MKSRYGTTSGRLDHRVSRPASTSPVPFPLSFLHVFYALHFNMFHQNLLRNDKYWTATFRLIARAGIDTIQFTVYQMTSATSRSKSRYHTRAIDLYDRMSSSILAQAARHLSILFLAGPSVTMLILSDMSTDSASQSSISA